MSSKLVLISNEYIYIYIYNICLNHNCKSFKYSLAIINETSDLNRDYHLLMVALSRFILLHLIHYAIIHNVSMVWQAVAVWWMWQYSINHENGSTIFLPPLESKINSSNNQPCISYEMPCYSPALKNIPMKFIFFFFLRNV